MMQNINDDLPIIALEDELEIINIDSNLLKESRQLMVQQLEENTPLLQNLFFEKDWRELEKLLFKLYGASLYCGLPRLTIALFNNIEFIKNNGTALQENFHELEKTITITLASLSNSLIT